MTTATRPEVEPGRVRALVTAAEALRSRLLDAATVVSRAAVTIDVPPDEVYDQWWALAMPTEAAAVDPQTGRSPGGPQGPAPLPGMVAREVEVLEDIPGQAVQWRSLGRAPALAVGRLDLRPAPGGRGTEVRVEVTSTAPPVPVRVLLGRRRPDQALRRGLRRFKATVEAGGPVAVDGQPHGRRSLPQLTLHAAVRAALGGDRA